MANALHEQVFQLMESYRRAHLGFVYHLRQRNTNNKFGEGYWFQGNEQYVFVGLYDRGGGSNMTRSFGLVFYLQEAELGWHLEIVHNEEADLRVLQFYQNAMNTLGGGFEKTTATKYKKLYSGQVSSSVADFLNYEKPKVDALIHKSDLASLFIKPERFKKSLAKVNSFRIQQTDTTDHIPANNQQMKPPLNQILYGPPGTGKTYHTINEAVAIANPDFDFKTADRTALKAEFERLKKEGQIVFTTFHQSMSYEDFVEGIKPQSPEATPEKEENYLRYEVEPGLFKLICDQARQLQTKKVDVNWEKANFHKMSLGGKLRPDIHQYCLENDVIALGYGGNVDLAKYKEYEDWYQFRDQYTKEYPEIVAESRFNIQAAYAFVVYMKPGDIVVASKGNHIIDAIGIIKGEYFYDDKNPFDFFHYRKVEWLVKDINTPSERFIKKGISQMTIYTFLRDDVKLEAFKELTNTSPKKLPKNYVLIIDEINRGNVSQIFGELITLIEPDKRLGKDEALTLTLPYSKTKFGVPSNLYLIGTMNTADRSVEALDTALRRRFHFTEMPPNSAIIKKHGKAENGEIDNYDLVDILEIINKRIEVLLDRDHLIGHSYFMQVESMADLKAAFLDRIIPLLQEYFYGDYGKIALVVGQGFCQAKQVEQKGLFANTKAIANLDSSDYAERMVFTLENFVDDNNNKNFKQALNDLLNRPNTETDAQ